MTNLAASNQAVPVRMCWWQSLIERGRRVTSSGSFIPEIDGFRFIAVVWVLAYHISVEVVKHAPAQMAAQADGSWLLAWLRTMNFGVQLFFVISGFILSYPFARHYCLNAARPALGKYYLRRLTRIEPPLLLNLTLLAGLILLAKKADFSQVLPHYLASVTYTHNLIYHDLSTINFVTWSLEIEAQFYLLAPLLVMLFAVPQRLRTGILCAVIVATALGNWYLVAAWPLVHLTLLGQLQYFLAGFLLSLWFCQRPSSPPPGRIANDVLAVATFSLLSGLLLWPTAWTAPLLPFVVVAAYISILRGRFTNAVFRWPLLTVIGGMCYTIYLYHPLLKSGLKHLTFRLHLGDTLWLNVLMQILLLSTAIIAISAVLFVLTEKPFMVKDWPANFWRWVRRRPAAPRQEP